MRGLIQIEKLCLICALLCGMLLSSCTRKSDAIGTQGDLKTKSKWVKEHLLNADPQLPFSFIYDGKASSELLKTWQKKAETTILDSNRNQYAHIWTDTKTGLEVRCVSVEYSDFPSLEWTVYFKNTGTINTPILESIQAIDHIFPLTAQDKPRLHYIKGDATGPGYAPQEKLLDPGGETHFAPANGRPTDTSFPYYNVEWEGRGVILVVGWSGQWASSFTRSQQGDLHVKAGQELTHFTLHPGEEARSPMILMQFWDGGDWIDAQNVWRRWMRAHNMPKPGGRDVTPIRAGSSPWEGILFSLNHMNEKAQISFIDRYSEEKIKLTHWWIDIYGGSTNFLLTDETYLKSGAFRGLPGITIAGDWNADRRNFPNGLRAVSDHAGSKGAKLIVWYEPEHVWPGYTLYEHQDWLLSSPTDPETRASINQGVPLGERRLLNLGHPEALKWLIDHFSKVIGEEGIGVYRQDFNIEPLVFWRHADLPDRRGMTENLYVQGYLRFFDALLEHHPDLLIDACASGGRRNDLETMRRSVPLWRSDTWGDPVIHQDQTYGLAFWIPYFGTGVSSPDTYTYRSSFGASMVSFWNMQDRKLDCNSMRQQEAGFWQAAPFFLEDYYPLTDYSTAQDSWMAWQFDRPEQGDGLVQAFRRDKCDEPVKTFSLRGLNPSAQYEVTNVDVQGSTKVTGRELIEKGLRVEIKGKPGAALITYKELK